MRYELTQQEIDSYRENGFVVLDEFLSPGELAEWREALDDALKTRGDTMLPKTVENDFNKSTEEKVEANKAIEYYAQVFIQRVNLWMDSEWMKRLILDPRIGKIACDLEGVDGMRVWHDQTLIKTPWGNPTGWHLDNPYWSFSSEHAISIWVALDDATLENGCLWYIPGTHKKKSFENVGIGPNMGDLFKVHTDWADKKAVPAVMKAGSCGLHNGLTAHGANANMTPGFRRAMTCAFMPDGATFNGQQNVLPKDYFKMLKVGDPLDNDAQNPIVYKKGVKVPA